MVDEVVDAEPGTFKAGDVDKGAVLIVHHTALLTPSAVVVGVVGFDGSEVGVGAEEDGVDLGCGAL